MLDGMVRLRDIPDLTPQQRMEVRHAEIARRYADKAKRAGPLSFAALRLAEIHRLLKHRHRRVLPDDDAGLTAARVAVHHIARLRDASRRMDRWLEHWAPWLDLPSRERLIREATEKALRWRADKLAWKLQVTPTERAELKLRTIGAMGETAKDRKAKARQRQRERQQARRSAAGAMPRQAYEANSISRAKPWSALGMSRAAWYRAGKPQP